MMSLELPLSAEQLVPHRLPMRLVDRLLSVDGKNGVAETVVANDCPLLDDSGQLEGIALIEMVAQGYAAVKGYCDSLEQKPVRQGFLVGIKKLAILEPVWAGDKLRIVIRTLGELEDFSIAEGQVWREQKMVARGEIKVWVN